MEKLAKWAKWKRNLMYWGYDGRFDTRMDPNTRKVHILDSDFEVVEFIDLKFSENVKRFPKEMMVLVEIYVFEWSVKKIAQRRRLSQYAVRSLRKRGEELMEDP